MWSRPIAVLVSGFVFGAAATWLNVPPRDHVLHASARRVASLVVNAGAAWAGVAVLGGWLLGSVRRGVLGGPLALVAAVAAYYLLGAVVGSEDPGGSSTLIAFYGCFALLAGPPLGAVGGALRKRNGVGLVAALVLPLGAAVELAWRASSPGLQPDPARPAANLVLFVLALSGAAAAVLAHRRCRGRRAAAGGRAPV